MKISRMLSWAGKIGVVFALAWYIWKTVIANWRGRTGFSFFRILLSLYCHGCWARSVADRFPFWIRARATGHWELNWRVGRRGKGGIGAAPTWTLTRALCV